MLAVDRRAAVIHQRTGTVQTQGAELLLKIEVQSGGRTLKGGLALLFNDIVGDVDAGDQPDCAGHQRGDHRKRDDHEDQL